MSLTNLQARNQFKGKAETEFSAKSNLYMRRLTRLVTKDKLDHPTFYYAKKRLNQTLAFRLFADIW